MTATPVPHDLPSASPLASLGGIARHGFLETTGRLWRAHGDTFRLRLGVGDMLFAVHPDSVKEVQLTRRRSFDKRASYDGVRRYLTGDGLVASTGELWKRQRKLMAPFFTPRGVVAYADIMLADADRASRSNGPQDADELRLVASFLRRPPPELRVAPLDATAIRALLAALPSTLAA